MSFTWFNPIYLFIAFVILTLSVSAQVRHYEARHSCFLVVANGIVMGEFHELNFAKRYMRKLFPARSTSPSRLVLEVVDGITQKDPHTVDGQDQGAGIEAGFSKFWKDWNDIKNMVRVGEFYITNHYSKVVFLVIANRMVMGLFADLRAAKMFLKNLPDKDLESRMVLEVIDGIAQPDPHVIGGQQQGAGLGAGFNKKWDDQADIKAMVKIGQDYMSEIYFP